MWPRVPVLFLACEEFRLVLTDQMALGGEDGRDLANRVAEFTGQTDFGSHDAEERFVLFYEAFEENEIDDMTRRSRGVL